MYFCGLFKDESKGKEGEARESPKPRNLEKENRIR